MNNNLKQQQQDDRLTINIDDELTVADLVAKFPSAKHTLEKFGIDYCCGGKKKIIDAASEHGIDIRKLSENLNWVVRKHDESAVIKDWNTESLKKLIEHILKTHHSFMKRELPLQVILFEKVLRAHGKSHGNMLKALKEIFTDLKIEIDQHLLKEEEILFPAIVNIEMFLNGNGPRPVICCGSVQNPIRQMEHEHEHAGKALAEMRNITHGYQLPEDACPSFEALFQNLEAMEKDLHEHIHLENNILFPRITKLEELL